MGRKGKYNDKIVKEICDKIEGGWTYKGAAVTSGITNETFWQWMDKKPDFSDSVSRASEKYQRFLLDKIEYAAQEPRNWGAAAWILERRFKRQYSPRQEVTGESGEGVKLEIEVIQPKNNEGKS